MKKNILLMALMLFPGALFAQNENSPMPPNSQQPNDSKASTTKAQNLNVGMEISGLASWYADGFNGKPTASGVLYDENKLTAASKSLPFGTILKITNLANNKSVNVTVNDRGPYVKGRILDLSKKAAEVLGYAGEGVAFVKATIVQLPDEKQPASNSDVQLPNQPVRPMAAGADINDNECNGKEGGKCAHAERNTKAISKIAPDGVVIVNDNHPNDNLKVNRIFVIQFGAFSSMASAQTYQDKLKNQGIKSYVAKEGSSSTKVLYKVREATIYRDIQQLFAKVLDYKKRGLDCFAVGKFFVGSKNTSQVAPQKDNSYPN